MPLNREKLLEIAVDVVAEAARLARESHKTYEVSTKSTRNDLVTTVDIAIEGLITSRLHSKTGYPCMGEEGHSIDSFAGPVWVIDPIDGTMNYVMTHRDYAISLALCVDGIPTIGVVCDVTADTVYTAIEGQGAWCDGKQLSSVPENTSFREGILIADVKELEALPRLTQLVRESRGHRRYGSAALECIEVARQQAAAFVHLWVSPWDIAAAQLICQEAGVRVTRMDGTPLDTRYKGSILAAWPQAHSEMLQRLCIDPC